MTASSTADEFRHFAAQEAAGSSPSYERLAQAIADDDTIVGRLEALPRRRRQPNLLLAACRSLGAPVSDTEQAIDFLHERWSEIEAVVRRRSTQTNEPARTSVFLPVLTALPPPIALIELGASAGLCLYPDRYRIRYDDEDPVGPDESPVSIDVETNGAVPSVAAPLDIAWRAGIDLSPLDVSDPDDVAWLEACIWPEHTDRADRLRRAIDVVALDPPDLVEGDLLDSLDEILGSTPADATTVVFHSAVLNYVDEDRRREVGELLRAADVVWLSNEAPGVIEGIGSGSPPMAGSHFVLCRGGTTVLATSHPHGRWLAWEEQPA